MENSQETATLIEVVLKFQDKVLWGLQIMKTWRERNVQPEGWREFPMFEYRGLRDPSRLLNREDSENEAEQGYTPCNRPTSRRYFMEVTMDPYCQSNPRPGVIYCGLLYISSSLEASRLVLSSPFFIFLDIKGFDFNSTTALLL